ncbi:hypothetical protein DQ04_14371000, partial [Trypanosoma grayi]|uniref:hypothetical protein n=1 Tax=Trypanosoma grayi TaxID=71804 RepID=UPI0004F43179
EVWRETWIRLTHTPSLVCGHNSTASVFRPSALLPPRAFGGRAAADKHAAIATLHRVRHSALCTVPLPAPPAWLRPTRRLYLRPGASPHCEALRRAPPSELIISARPAAGPASPHTQRGGESRRRERE